ncbi:bile acid:sodium symporter family protein [Pleomorphovibrio marinus]|uniref:bile acid:sodium symporter family protein n=1 Tax=Pleomorphovibrio marinus TaxID=2164132 RepID=UPI001E37B3A3|nr:bile acid:sodium symporter family protein [Pleomorphovibrio marinus]
MLAKKYLQGLLVFLALLAFFYSLFVWFGNKNGYAGVVMLCGIVALFLALLLTAKFNTYLYTLLILGFALAALLFPDLFTSLGPYELTPLITPLIQFVMFGMGCTLTIRDFLAIAKSPKGVFLGLGCQLTIMPITGAILAYLSNLPTEVAAGIILVGCSPSGVASNVLSYLAKANLALSVSITSLSTVLAPFVTPLLMRYLAGSMVEIALLDMMWNIAKMVLIPIVAGLIVNYVLEERAKSLHRILPLLSMITVALVIAIITASGKPQLVEMGWVLLAMVLLHNILGLILGYGAGKLLGMNEEDCRTISIEVGSQNGGMAGALAGTMGKISTMGLAPAIFSVVMNITGSLLASFWQARPPLK